MELSSQRVSVHGTLVSVPSSPRVAYWRSLDGVRGVAVLLVLLAHAGLLNDRYAGIAVNTFFVLSGFLITSILVGEWDRTGTVSIRTFYARRALRLLPALVASLLVFVALALLLNNEKRAMAVVQHGIRALFYWTNWAQIERYSLHNPFNHTWSLSIEEQFYILWPWLLCLLLRKCTRSSVLCWIGLFCFISAVVRFAIITMDPTSLGHLRRANLGLDTRADSLLLGSCLGAAYASGTIRIARRGWKWMLRIASGISFVGLWWMGRTGWLLNPPQVGYGWSVASLFAAAVIAHLVMESESPQHSILEFAPLVFVGTISYGLYVWHFPILHWLRSRDVPNGRILFWAISVAAALLSYYAIERPFLRWKARLSGAAKQLEQG